MKPYVGLHQRRGYGKEEMLAMRGTGSKVPRVFQQMTQTKCVVGVDL